MAGAALPGRLSWQTATVRELLDETPSTKSIVLELPGWAGHRAGQHVDVRLTAEDGYQAQRSYSLASAPDQSGLMLTVQRLEDGEVSPYLVDVLEPGDPLELRGPIGGYFVWEAALGGPLLLIGGGSGIVPLRAIVEHHAAIGSQVPLRMLYSARSQEDLIYRAELERLAGAGELELEVALTRAWPEDWQGHRGRVDAQLLGRVAWEPAARALVYVCGPSGFVETVANTLVELGHDARRVRTERFGPTGS
ncbi:MAG TPA: ferredoxin reductase [Solirubrobacteraceae bacterium]|nr:ferredoxin reductase [Solirubrobacteraceae bacterium]